ncbi:MAG: type II secretion system protein [bacterium]|nr:type II secretion system protein [bacterium]
MNRFFKQKGVSLVELLIAGLILIFVSLFVSTTFMRGSVNLVSSWDETVSQTTMQELAEEIKGVARGYYRFIKVRTLTENLATHHHINIPCLVQAGTSIKFRVVAHDSDHNRTHAHPSSSPVSIEWEQVAGEGTVTADFRGKVSLRNDGISNEKEVTFTSTGSKPIRGYLHIDGHPNGPRTERAAGIIVYPQAGERIEKGDLKGTRTAIFELFDDPLDNPPYTTEELLPGDYMKGTITFSYQRKSQTGTGTKNMVMIIAPFPE